jgi:hypothetical protein
MCSCQREIYAPICRHALLTSVTQPWNLLKNNEK